MMEKDESREKLKAILSQTDKMIGDTQAFLLTQGIVVDLNDWVTLSEYCRRFEIKRVETVINWINRGIVPAENVRVIEEFNNTRLIKAIPYLTKTAKVVE